MRKPCTGIIAGVAGVLFLSALVAAQNNAQECATFAVEILSGGCEGQRGTRRARAEARSERDVGGRVIWRGCKRLRRPPERATAHAVGQGVVGPEQGGRPRGPHRRVERSSSPILRSVWFSSEHERADPCDDDHDAAEPDLCPAHVHEHLARDLDGRTNPSYQFAGRGTDVHDPTYNGYSVGRWEDDYTFVAETTGMAPETWATEAGYPHSVDARVTERFIGPARTI